MGLVEPEAAPVAALSRSRWSAAGWIAALLLGAVALWAWMRPAPPESKQVTRFTVPWDSSGAPFPLGIAVSRDGARMAFAAGAQVQIFVRQMDSPEVRAIPGTEGGQYPAFSPNGDWIVFQSGDQLKKIPVTGGSAQTLVRDASRQGAAFWGNDDKILFGTNKGLLRIGVEGGEPETLLGVEAHLEKGEIDGVFMQPQLLPGGKAILYHVGKSSGRLLTAVLDLTTRKPKTIPEVQGFARYLASGHLVYPNEAGSLMAAPFDEDRLELVGPPVSVMEGVATYIPLLIAFSETGTLAYWKAGVGAVEKNLLVWVDRKGVEQVIPVRPDLHFEPRISPDGKHIAMLVVDERIRLGPDVWVYDLPNGPLTRRTFEGGNFLTSWTPDGKRLIVTDRASRSIVSIPFDGSGPPKVLVETSANSPSDISPDGKILIGSTGGSNDVLLWPVREKPVQGDENQPYPNGIMNTPSRKSGFRFSPDGRWVAYMSAESGRPEVFVAPYPGPGPKSQVSIDGGATPRWSRDGRELFFMNGTRLMAAAVETRPSFKVSNTPKVLFDYPGYLDTAQYDVSPDGRRFLMTKNAPVQPGQQQAGQIHVVLNWFEELRRRAPAGK
ncbi:MAG: PD40 domain-containing protein [Acidobacteria bacterium]|nr:PD40 domain-containing protein [Acidobacteriota bacterium]